MPDRAAIVRKIVREPYLALEIFDMLSETKQQRFLEKIFPKLEKRERLDKVLALKSELFSSGYLDSDDLIVALDNEASAILLEIQIEKEGETTEPTEPTEPTTPTIEEGIV